MSSLHIILLHMYEKIIWYNPLTFIVSEINTFQNKHK